MDVSQQVSATDKAAAKASKNRKNLEHKQKEVKMQQVRKQKELAKMRQADSGFGVLQIQSQALS